MGRTREQQIISFLQVASVSLPVLVVSKSAYRPAEKTAQAVSLLNWKRHSCNAKEIFEAMLSSLNRFLWQADRLTIQMILYVSLSTTISRVIRLWH